MKPETTVPVLAIKTPGQGPKAQDILLACAPEVEANSESIGSILVIKEVETKMALTIIMKMILGISLTNSMQFGIFKTQDEAMRAFDPPARGTRSAPSGSGSGSSNSFDPDDFLTNLLTDVPGLEETLNDPTVLMFQNPDVSKERFAEVFQAKEFIAVRNLREADDRHILTLEECIKIAHDYASAFPDVAAHDPRWDGKPIIEWLDGVDGDWAIRGDSIEPTAANPMGLPRGLIRK